MGDPMVQRCAINCKKKVPASDVCFHATASLPDMPLMGVKKRGRKSPPPLFYVAHLQGEGSLDQAEANIFLISRDVTGRRASPTRFMLSVFRPPRLARGETSTSLPSSRR